MKSVLAALGILAALFCASLPARAETACPAETSVVAVPAKGGPAYGGMQYARSAGLGPKEVALTFDDGPNPETTPAILDILDRHCVKATFFMVGIHAQKHPEIVREVAARGHTIGTHTWSHPNNLRHFSLESARRQIRQGFAAFFRFPGLNDSKPLMAWLGERNIATLSCEFGADDWRSISAAQVRTRALRNIASVGRGILILHDTKPRTAEMLSSLIAALRADGYSFAQLVPEEGARELAAASRDPLIGAVRRVDIRDEEPETAVLKPSLEPATTLQ